MTFKLWCQIQTLVRVTLMSLRHYARTERMLELWAFPKEIWTWATSNIVLMWMISMYIVFIILFPFMTCCLKWWFWKGCGLSTGPDKRWWVLTNYVGCVDVQQLILLNMDLCAYILSNNIFVSPLWLPLSCFTLKVYNNDVISVYYFTVLMNKKCQY